MNSKKIKEFVAKNSYFGFDNKEDEALMFSTRKHGEFYEEGYGEQDLQAGNILKEELLKEFPGIEVLIDTCDEWIMLFVKDKPFLKV